MRLVAPGRTKKSTRDWPTVKAVPSRRCRCHRHGLDESVPRHPARLPGGSARAREDAGPADQHLARRHRRSIELQRAEITAVDPQVLMRAGQDPFSGPVVRDAAGSREDAGEGRFGVGRRHHGEEPVTELDRRRRGADERADDVVESIQAENARPYQPDGGAIGDAIRAVDAQRAALHARVADVVAAGGVELDGVAAGPEFAGAGDGAEAQVARAGREERRSSP